MPKKHLKKVKFVSKESLDLTEENLIKLKSIFPEIFSEEKIDFEKLKILLGSEIEDSIEKYNFTWAGRSNAFRNIQTTVKGTLIPDEKDSVDFDKTENLFIEGDNLEVLKLLQKSYQNKIKMIYIDPPYNTGKDFVYKDNFKDSIGNYEKITGQIDEEGNRSDTNKETNGRFHSDWLTMIYPRLYLAKNLLKEDGVIFVSIDDHEVHNLRKIMDDIFGEENFVGDFIWKNKAGGGGKQSGNKPGENTKKKEAFVLDHEFVLVYSKNIEELFRFNEALTEEDLKGYSNPDDDSRGPYKLGNLEMMMPKPISTMYYPMKDPDGIIVKPKGGRHQWRFSEKRTKEGLEEGSVVWVKSNCSKSIDKRGYRYILKSKQYLYQGDEERTKIARSVLYKLALNADGTREIMEIFGQDKTEVPIFTNPKPTKLLKYFLSIVDTKNEIILDFFAGSGTTAHAVLDLNKDGGNRKFICVQLPEKTDEKELLKQMELFQSPLIASYKKINLIYEVLIKEGYDLHSKIEEVKDIKTNKVFRIGNGEKYFFICLDEKIKEQTIKNLKLGKEIMFVCLDDSLEDNQKINLSLKINLRSI